MHTEVQHRIKVAWMKFGQHSKTLCNKNISIKLRLRLFDSTVSPSLLFGLAVLPLQALCMEKLNIVQRKMMRKIVGWVRLPEEPWENTMRRMSARVDIAVGQLKVKEWSARILDTQWKFVGRLKFLPSSSWPSRAAFWQPPEIDDPSCAFLPHRAQGRPFTRWDDKVTKFSCEHFGEIWQEVPHLSFLRALPKFVSGLSS